MIIRIRTHSHKPSTKILADFVIPSRAGNEITTVLYVGK